MDIQPERNSETRAHLLLLLHAAQCDGGGCTRAHCGAMKLLVAHVLKCRLGVLCDRPHCCASHHVLKHHQRCVVLDCPICDGAK